MGLRAQQLQQAQHRLIPHPAIGGDEHDQAGVGIAERGDALDQLGLRQRQFRRPAFRILLQQRQAPVLVDLDDDLLLGGATVAALTCGSFTSTPRLSSGAVTMKMISSTSITSM